MHVQSCCFANKTYCFLMHTPCKNKQNKRVFLVVAENFVGSLCVLNCWQNLLYYVFGVFLPLQNTKKLPNKQKQLIKTKTRSHAKTKASLADIFPFPLNTDPGPRLPS